MKRRMRQPVLLIAIASAVAWTASCSSEDGKEGAEGPVKEPVSSVKSDAAGHPVVTEAEARQILENADRENNAANAEFDAARLATIEGGVMYEQSTAAYQVDKLAKNDPNAPFYYIDPQFWIPRDTGAYPRYFAALSTIHPGQPITAMRFFAQEAPGAPWKSVFTRGLRLGDAEPTTPPGQEPTVYPKAEQVARDAAGLAKTVADPDAARRACDDYAAYLSIGPKWKDASNPRFAPGAFTDEIVTSYNATILGTRLGMTVKNTVTGGPLPIFQLASGAGLVPCAFYTDVHFEAPQGSELTLDTDGAVTLLGGKNGPYQSADQHHIALAFLSVPAAPGAAVTVLDSTAAQPQILSAKAVPVKP